MPAIESMVQSIGSPRTFHLRDGRTVELRQGCLVDAATRETVCGSLDTARVLTTHARLSDGFERELATYWGPLFFHTCGNEWMTVGQALRNKT